MLYKPQTSSSIGWRTPAVILVCGCLISTFGFGPRSALGLFLTPMSSAHGWGRDVFALALAIQMLLWGACQPFAGAVADRFGAMRVLSGGAILYAIGLVLMAYSQTPAMLQFTAGVVLGFGIAGSSFTVVLGAFGKLLPERWRSFAFGAGTAAGLIDGFGWQHALLIFAAIVLVIIPLTLALTVPAGQGDSGSAAHQSIRHALTEALS